MNATRNIDLSILDLAGSVVAVVQHSAGLGEGSGIYELDSQEAFDFDGDRIAWTKTNCFDNELYVADVNEITHAQGLRHCPVRLRERTLSVTRTGNFVMHVRCPRGCYGYWDISGPRSLVKAINRAGQVSLDKNFYSQRGGVRRATNGFWHPTFDAIKRLHLKKIQMRFESYFGPIDGNSFIKDFPVRLRFRR